MRILSRIIKPITYTFAAGSLFLGANYVHAQNRNTKGDTFETQAVTQTITVPPDGTDDWRILSNAPSPEVTVAGKVHSAALVIDVKNNVLYHYNDDGTPIKAYSVATGAPETPTHLGIRYITHVEHAPYTYAPASTKRHRKPWLFGDHAILFQIVDEKTGARRDFGEFPHGTNQPSSIGKKVSGGCIRMSKKAINELASTIKTKRYVRIF